MSIMRWTKATLLVAALGSIAGPTARAQDALALAPAQIESLAHALLIYGKAAQERVFGPGTHRIVPEGDSLRVSLPIGVGYLDVGVIADDMTLRAKSLGGPRWFFDQLHLPRTITSSVGKANPLTLDTVGLTLRADVDQSHATETTASHAADRVTVRNGAAPDRPNGVATEFRIGKIAVNTVLGAAIAGRLDATASLALDDLGLTTTVTRASTVNRETVAIGKLLFEVRAGQLSPERLLALQPAMAAMNAAEDVAKNLSPTADAAVKEVRSTAHRDASRQLTAVLRDVLSSLEISYDTDNFVVDAPNRNYSIGKARMLLAVGTVGGRLDVRHSIDMRDFKFGQELQSASIRALLPRRFLMTPHLTGASSDTAATMLRQLLDDPTAGEAAAERLLLANPVHVAIETLSFDVGPASNDATGCIDFRDVASEKNTSVMDVRMVGFADLQAMVAASAEPGIAKLGLPVLVFAKGMAKQEGDGLSWHIDVDRGTLIVNGLDLQSMIPRYPVGITRGP